jgi:hypothetical protein
LKRRKNRSSTQPFWNNVKELQMESSYNAVFQPEKITSFRRVQRIRSWRRMYGGLD